MSSHVDEGVYDYVIVGGGTAGAILAARLSEDPQHTVGLVEWGPSDEGEERALQLECYPDMLGSEYDLSYPCVPTTGEDRDYRLARGRILGGTSSINNMGALPPLPNDLDAWNALGASDWEYEEFARLRQKVAAPVVRPGADDRNACLEAAIEAAAEELGVPILDAWPTEQIMGGVGYLDLGYDPATGHRSSSSVAYLHGVHDKRANLDLILQHRVVGIEFEGNAATGVRTVNADGGSRTISARREVIVSCGAIDTPRVLMLSGVGPADHLAQLGIESRVDLPGVGANLMDHVESLVIFELRRTAAGGWPSELDAVAFVARTEAESAAPDVMAHMFRFAADESYGGAKARGFDQPEHTLAITPNVTRPLSRGTVRLASADPSDEPVIDFRYFSDPQGHDRATILAGVEMARRVGASPPLSDWVTREVFPGPELQDDDELFDRIRATHGSVCHAAGTCRMGRDDDEMAVLDPRLRVRGLANLRIVDASAFPTLTTFNPMITVMMLAERAAELIKQDA